MRKLASYRAAVMGVRQEAHATDPDAPRCSGCRKHRAEFKRQPNGDDMLKKVLIGAALAAFALSSAMAQSGSNVSPGQPDRPAGESGTNAAPPNAANTGGGATGTAAPMAAPSPAMTTGSGVRAGTSNSPGQPDRSASESGTNAPKPAGSSPSSGAPTMAPAR